MIDTPKLTRQEHIIVHESLPVGVLLALAGGFLDAYTYLFHGEVFASVQSGNVILLGLNIAQGKWGAFGHYLPPIILFLFGILTTNILKNHFKGGKWIVWQNVAVLIEALGIFLVGLFSGRVSDIVFNSAMSFFAAIQNATYRRLAGMPYATTMTTGNLRSIADYAYQWIFKRDRQAAFKIKYTALIVGGFFAGAILSTLLAPVFKGQTIWCVSVFLLLVLGIALKNHNE